MSLFRDEVLALRRENLHGTINLSVPVGWHVIAASLAAIVVVAALFLLTASYSRTEVATGSVLPATGILQIVPPRQGRVEAVLVEEGQVVRRGELLARISSEQTDGSGEAMQSRVLSAIERQQRGILEQQALTRAGAESEQGLYETQIAGLRQEADDLRSQIALQVKLVDMARAELAQAQDAADRGFISRRDFARREETLLTRQQQLLAFRQAAAAKASSTEQAIRSRQQAAARASDAGVALAASGAQLDREHALATGEKGYSLVAPADGRVAGLSINAGDSLKAQDAAMMIVPTEGRLIARLLIPGKAAGFVRSGQTVRLALDSYPYERFGTVEGRIAVLATAPVLRTESDGGTTPFYPATVSIADPSVRAYGRRHALLPGMTLTARILLERRSLLQWLFDPLLAATGR